MPWVFIADGVDTRRMNQYVTALVFSLQREPWPDDMAVRQLCEELDEDPDMYSAVWAHLQPWQRSIIRGIRQGKETAHVNWKDFRHD